MPVIIIHRLEVVDVHDKHGDRLAAAPQIARKLLKVSFQIAPVIKSRQAIRDRCRQAFFILLPEIIFKLFTPDLRLCPRCKLVLIDRAHQVIIYAEVERFRQAFGVAVIEHNQDRGMTCHPAGTKL